MNEQITVELGTNVTNLFEKLAAQIGTTIDKVYPLYVAQQVNEAVINMSFTLIALLITSLMVFFSHKKATFTKDTTIYDVVLLVGFVSMIMSAIVTVIGFPYWIKQIINPEYYAISDLIAQLK